MGTASSGRLWILVIGLLIAAIGIGVRYSSKVRPASNTEGETPKPITVDSSALTQPSTQGPEISPELVARGKSIFQSQCATCHGLDGAGKGEAAYLLNPKPRDLTKRSFRLISNLEGVVQVDDIFHTISRGMPGSGMPSWEILSEQDRWAVSHYVNSLSRPDKRIPKPIPFGIEPPVTPESVLLGRKAYEVACAACHGVDAKGTPQQPQFDSDGYPTKPRDLTRGVFKGGRDGKQLFTRIAAGMPGSPMPSQMSTLDTTTIWNLVHYVQSISDPAAEERNVSKFKTLTSKPSTLQNLNDPSSEAWTAVPATSLALLPLWWRDDRPETIEVRTVYDDKDLYVRLSWNDATHNDEQLISQGFRDGVAVAVASGEIPPSFVMGAKGVPDVRIWHWKADRQTDVAGRRDVHTAHPDMYVTTFPVLEKDKSASESMGVDYGGLRDATKKEAQKSDKTFLTGIGAGNPVSQFSGCPVESLTSHGLGTLDPRPISDQGVDAKGVWDKGTYSVVFRRPLQQSGDHALSLKAGDKVFVAFAVWDGSAGDRNGQKNVTIWQCLQIEK